MWLAAPLWDLEVRQLWLQEAALKAAQDRSPAPTEGSSNPLCYFLAQWPGLRQHTPSGSLLGIVFLLLSFHPEYRQLKQTTPSALPPCSVSPSPGWRREWLPRKSARRSGTQSAV